MPDIMNIIIALQLIQILFLAYLLFMNDRKIKSMRKELEDIKKKHGPYLIDRHFQVSSDELIWAFKRADQSGASNRRVNK